MAAPPERCFDLARSVDLHTRSTSATGEQAVGGVTTGLLGLGQEVTWQARHFGVRQELTSRITAYDRPRHFRDSMVRGAFRRFDHDHFFEPTPTGSTIVRDVFDFEAPLGFLGRLAERLFLTRYMRRFLAARNAELKAVAESADWERYVTAELGHVAPFFIVRDVLPSIAFYTDRLGFEVMFLGPDGDPYFAMLKRDGVRLMLKAITPEVQPTPNPGRHPWARWDAYIYTPDPDALAAEFARRGVSFREPLGVNSDQLRGFEVMDADGYVLYFGRPV